MTAEHLRGLGFSVKTTREPGGTPLGRQIRDLVLNASGDSLTAATELALMFAARAQHLEQVILPALRSGAVVLCDRFTDSSVAYQGYGSGVPLDTIRTLETLLCQGVRPDWTLVLDVDPEIAARRAGERNREARQAENRFEKEGLEFFQRVREGYRAIARQEPARVRIIDARGSVAETQQAVRRSIEEFLGSAS